MVELQECPLCKAAGLKGPSPRWEWLGGTRGKDSWSSVLIPSHFTAAGAFHPRHEIRRVKDE